MYKKRNPHDPYFQGVALAVIVFGSFVFAVGVVQWLYETLGTQFSSDPMLKVVGGAVVVVLGYVLLELELIRIKS